MKILITTDLFTTTTNGVVTSLRNLYEELTKKGHDVRILTLSENLKSYKEGAVYYICSAPLKIYPDVRMPLVYRHKLIKELIAWKPDVIHSQCEFFSYQFALKISKATGAPIVHTFHTLYDEYIKYVFPFKRLGSRILHTTFKKRLKSARIIAPTKKVEAVLKDYGFKNQVNVVPSGINLEKHKNRITSEKRIEKRRSLGIKDDQIVLLNLGRLGNEKNVDEIIQFFSKAIISHEKLVLLIVGDGPAKSHLEELSKELNIQDRVIFTGMVDPSEVSEYYQLGDIFVSASTSETQGLTYIEAAANELPLLCRRDACLEEIIVEGENGYEYTNEGEFLDFVDMVDDPRWRSDAGSKSAQIVSSFDKEVFADAIESIYKSVITK